MKEIKKSEKAIAKEEGIKEGENKKMRELALNMKNKGLDNKTIAEYLSICIKDLEELLNS